LLRHQLDAGHLGEMIAQKVLLDAMDKCVQSVAEKRMNWFLSGRADTQETDGITPIPLNHFLKQLYKGESTAYNHVTEALKSIKQDNACVFFNHFVQLREDITIKHIRQSMQRCCALVLNEGAKGADLCVPAFDPNTQQLSLIIWIQVKNRNRNSMANSTKQEGWWKKLQPKNIFSRVNAMSEEDRQIPSLCILFSMNPEHTKPINPPPTSQASFVEKALCTEEKLDKWKTEFFKKNHEVTFWQWVLSGKAGCKTRVELFKEALHGTDDLSSCPPRPDAEYRRCVLGGWTLSMGEVVCTSILLSEILQTLYPMEGDAESIVQIMKSRHDMKVSPFDRDQRMKETTLHIQNLATNLPETK